MRQTKKWLTTKDKHIAKDIVGVPSLNFQLQKRSSRSPLSRTHPPNSKLYCLNQTTKRRIIAHFRICSVFLVLSTSCLSLCRIPIMQCGFVPGFLENLCFSRRRGSRLRGRLEYRLGASSTNATFTTRPHKTNRINKVHIFAKTKK